VVQSQIAIERDRVDILRRENTLADQTLLTDAEQKQKAHELGGEISKASAAPCAPLSRDARRRPGQVPGHGRQPG
jgi:hypothetical protein